MNDPHADLAKFDQAVAEHEARQLADEIGYTFGVLTDGTIVLEPPRDPNHCGLCRYAVKIQDQAGRIRAVVEGRPTHGADGDHCAKCGTLLDALTRCQNVIPDPTRDGGFMLEFVCRDHLIR